MLDFDKFTQSFTMQLDEGRGALPSWMGALCSFILFVVIIAYTCYKVDVLVGKKSVDILSAVNENYYDDSYIFGAK